MPLKPAGFQESVKDRVNRAGHEARASRQFQAVPLCARVAKHGAQHSEGRRCQTRWSHQLRTSATEEPWGGIVANRLRRRDSTSPAPIKSLDTAVMSYAKRRNGARTTAGFARRTVLSIASRRANPGPGRGGVFAAIEALGALGGRAPPISQDRNFVKMKA